MDRVIIAYVLDNFIFLPLVVFSFVHSKQL